MWDGIEEKEIIQDKLANKLLPTIPQLTMAPKSIPTKKQKNSQAVRNSTSIVLVLYHLKIEYFMPSQRYKRSMYTAVVNGWLDEYTILFKKYYK